METVYKCRKEEEKRRERDRKGELEEGWRRIRRKIGNRINMRSQRKNNINSGQERPGNSILLLVIITVLKGTHK